jgi:dTDP-4-amino-4,6-dideoxy-D-galactose acyltransferase
LNPNRILSEIKPLLEERKTELSVYSPFNFLHHIDSSSLSEETFIKPLLQEILTGTCKVKEIIVKGHKHYFIYKNLIWDSRYFNFNVNRIELILFKHNELKVLNIALKRFIKEYIRPGEYFFINIPCEEIVLIQAISFTDFKLVETRLNYYLSNIQNYQAQRYRVRKANEGDIQLLKKIAMRMRNKHDRVHADPSFSMEDADSYLGTFIEESIKGFADMVIIPDIVGVEPFGFLAANKPQKVMGLNIARLVLAAVDNSFYKGWLFNLLSEVIYELKNNSTDYLTTITQASNRPAIHTWEKAGFKLGFTTHIYSYYKA